MNMRRMKDRVNSAVVQYPVLWWTRMAKYLWEFAARVKSASYDTWLAQTSKWKPEVIDDVSCEYVPHRSVGCPRLKWDDEIRNICLIHFDACWHDVSIETFSARLEDFVTYYSSRV